MRNDELQHMISNRRKSIKRAIARFLYLKNVYIDKKGFNTLVRRTQDSGYESAIKFLSAYFKDQGYSPEIIKPLLYQFTIEYNVELYSKQFPKGEESIERIINNNKTKEDEIFFKEYLYDIVKANRLQCKIMNDIL